MRAATEGTKQRGGVRWGGMLAAVATQNPAYEGLSGYVQFASGPTSVPSGLPPFPGSKLAPQDTPAARAPVPSSSQRTHSNQRIPYARRLHADSVFGEDKVRAGGVVFVHKKSLTTGHGPDRFSEVAGIEAVNKLLESQPFEKTDAAETAAKNKFDEYIEANEDFTDLVQAAKMDKIAFYDIPVLKDWTPDGVLISRSDVTLEDVFEPLPGSRGDEYLTNVAIQGPTPFVTTACGCAPAMLDKIYVGVFAYKLDGDKIKFHMRCFNARERNFLHLEEKDKEIEPGFVHNPSAPLNVQDFKRLMYAYQIGTVTDAKKAERVCTVNVCVERVPAALFNARWGDLPADLDAFEFM